LGLRYYLQELLADEGLEELDVLTQEEMKRGLHQRRFQREALVRETLRFLTSQSGNAAIALIDKDVYYAGLSEMLNIPEFQEVDNLRSLLLILEDYSTLASMFNLSRSTQDVRVLIGEETGLKTFEKYAIVFSEINLHGDVSGYIAVVGPNRMDYQRVIPTVKFAAQTVRDLTSGW
jgi:heat-inducible transcriptional repressor